MSASVDGNTLAALIAACTAAFVSLITVYMQWCSWCDNRAIKQSQVRIEGEGKKREGKIDDLHSAVNGRMTELKIRVAEEAFEKGRKFQKDHANDPSPLMAKIFVDDMSEQIAGARELVRTRPEGGPLLP